MADKFDLGEIKFEGEDAGKASDDVSYFKSPHSTIHAYNYPACCTGAMLACFGGSTDGYYVDDDSSDYLKAQVVAWIELIRTHKVGFIGRKEFICACTTTEQDEANDVLEELGFERSKLMVNNVNDYPLYTWVLALSGYEEDV